MVFPEKYLSSGGAATTGRRRHHRAAPPGCLISRFPVAISNPDSRLQLPGYIPVTSEWPATFIKPIALLIRGWGYRISEQLL